MVDPKKPRLSWVNATVLKIMPSNDKLGRAAMIKSAGGLYIRPVHRLIKLDYEGPADASSNENRIFIGVTQNLRKRDMEDLPIPAKQVPKVKDIPGVAKLLANPNRFDEDL